jgi:hypothetical protein
MPNWTEEGFQRINDVANTVEFLLNEK